jgi:tetratricopeptide (TPR) repeat protein
MTSYPDPIRVILLSTLLILGLLGACEAPPVRPNLPPSASDLILLKAGQLCDRKEVFLKKAAVTGIDREPWGTGQELRIPAARSESKGDESFFFDQDGTLVGALFTFSSGLDLDPYPVLRYTLSQLKPSLEFYVTVAKLSSKESMETSALFETGDEKSTTQYLVLSPRERPTLLEASFSVDPYTRLFSPYRKEFLNRLRGPGSHGGTSRFDTQGAEDKEPFASLQQFARGQTAQLAYCGSKDYAIAADAYQKAIAGGFSNKVWLAEAHHKLGLAWEAKGEMAQARAAIEQALALRPNVPEMLNNLGTVYAKLGEKDKARTAFEKAVTLRPNYALARFNLAESYEAINRKRAISEYETYLALAEGIPDESDRITLVKRRVESLRK